MAILLSSPSSNCRYDFSKLSSPRIHQILHANNLHEAQKIQNFSDLINRIKDWFHGGVEKKTIEELFTHICDIKNPHQQISAYSNSDIGRLKNFVALRELARPEYKDAFVLEISNNRYGDGSWEYQLSIDGVPLYQAHPIDPEKTLLNQFRTYAQDDRVTFSDQGEVTRIITAEAGQAFEKLLQTILSDNVSTAHVMPRSDGQFAPSNQFFIDVSRNQLLSFVRGESEEGYINFAPPPPAPTPEAHLSYMDEWLKKLTQITANDAIAFALTRHLNQSIAVPFLLLQRDYSSLFSPLSPSTNIMPSLEISFGVEKQKDSTFHVTVNMQRDAITHLTDPTADPVIKTMDPSRSYFDATFVMGISADGKTITHVAQPLALCYQCLETQDN
ncbi:MAG: hypothetical protein IT497_10235 [Ottowia sp.]|nr:hypothetical protein [Ottowia sp.]